MIWLIFQLLWIVSFGRKDLKLPKINSVMLESPFQYINRPPEDIALQSIKLDRATKRVNFLKQFLESNITTTDDKYTHILRQSERGVVSDKIFNRLMIRKCGLNETLFEQLNDYYEDKNIKNRECYDQLYQWNEDLHNGIYEAHRICDSWGEDVDLMNYPGLMTQMSFQSAFSRPIKAGMMDQCRSVRRMENGKELYRGKYFTSKTMTHGFLSNIEDIIEGLPTIIQCLVDCGDDEECYPSCYQGNIQFYDYYFTQGVCYPSACSSAEIIVATSVYINDTELTPISWVGKNGQKSYEEVITFDKSIGQTYPPMERVYLPTFISFVLFYAILLIIMTISSLWYHQNRVRNIDGKNDNIFILVFAYQIHWNKLCSTKRTKKAITTIDGVRSLSMLWVMLCHFYTTVVIGSNTGYAINQMKNGNWGSIYFATPSVDSFFVIGGLLLSYLSTDRIIKTFNTIPRFCSNYLIYLFNRWIRLTPLVMIVAWSIVSIYPVIPDGYSCLNLNIMQRVCETNLARAFFYITGWFEEKYGCNGVQWYLCCDFFYYALFPFIAIGYGKHKGIGIGMVCALTMGSWFHNFWSSQSTKVYIAQTYRIYTVWPDGYGNDPYFPPWARYHSHGIGVLFGWLVLHDRKTSKFSTFLSKVALPVRVVIISSLWAFSLFAIGFSMYGINGCFRVNWIGAGDYFDWNTIESFSGCLTDGEGGLNWIAISIWNASFRMLWCTGLGLLILLCDMKYGYIIDWFLSGKSFMFIGKLSFAMYLVHYDVLMVYRSSFKHDYTIDGYTLAWHFMAFVVYTGINAIFVYLTIETPFAIPWNMFVAKFLVPKPEIKTNNEVHRLQAKELESLKENGLEDLKPNDHGDLKTTDTVVLKANGPEDLKQDNFGDLKGNDLEILRSNDLDNLKTNEKIETDM